MQDIFIEKEIKYRLLKLVIFLCDKLGYIYQKSIYLPIHIKQIDLAIMLNTNTNTINKTIHILSRQKIIHYDNKRKISIPNIYLFRYYIYLLR